MCDVYSAMCYVRCALCSVQSAMCNERCATCNVRCALCSVRCALCGVRCSFSFRKEKTKAEKGEEPMEGREGTEKEVAGGWGGACERQGQEDVEGQGRGGGALRPRAGEQFAAGGRGGGVAHVGGGVYAPQKALCGDRAPGTLRGRVRRWGGTRGGGRCGQARCQAHWRASSVRKSKRNQLAKRGWGESIARATHWIALAAAATGVEGHGLGFHSAPQRCVHAGGRGCCTFIRGIWFAQ